MATKLSIANAALLKIGASPIMSLDDDSKAARHCKLRLQDVKETVLRMHPWNSASRRVVLSPLASGPAYDYSYQFQLPTDYIRMVSNSDEDYRIETDLLLSNDTSIEMKFVCNVDEPKLDPLLAECIACYLAQELSYPITQSSTVKNQAEEAFKLALSRARTADAQDEPAGAFEADLFLEARLQGTPTPLEARRKW